MANEKIHQYIDTATINDLENNDVVIDCEVYDGVNWLSKQLPHTAIMDYVDAPFQKIVGTFFDTSDQIHTNINQGKAIQCDTTNISQDVTVSNDLDSRPTLFYVSENGIYNVEFTLQFIRASGGSSKQASIWLRKNYNDVAWTNRHLTFVANSGKLVVCGNYVIEANISQPIQLIWSVDDTSIQMIHENANAVHPETPSAIISITKL